ncbi:MAG: hypothetical protein H6745_21770 [Deltaproteobacteria bacterium]|nr:hypothetical protein [Deltaproteobacteria bacterium]
MLNARFDVNYELRNYTDDPTDGDSAFANYHHFVFLSRASSFDPVYFSAEIVDLSFFAIGVREKVSEDWSLKAEIGKILVPFGAEPLFHHNYGGLAGFDNEVIPNVWAQYGLAAQARYGYADGSVRIDAYAMQGYELGAADGVVSLRTDFSSAGDAKIAAGARLSASYGPATFYYSFLLSPLGFDRRLVAQALDATLFGIPGVPVLEDMRLSVGALRADTVGGDAPNSYEFADYLELEYRPTCWLSFRYRGGLHTVDNREGLFYDSDRKGAGDGSAHTLAAAATWEGLTFQLSHTWRLEKATELDNDFLRFTVSYDL